MLQRKARFIIMKISEKNLSDKTVTNILYAVSAVIILTVVVLTIMAFAMQNRSVRGSRKKIIKIKMG